MGYKLVIATSHPESNLSQVARLPPFTLSKGGGLDLQWKPGAGACM